MTHEPIVMLLASAPLLAAVVCRLNEFDWRRMSWAAGFVTWVVGCMVAAALVYAFDSPPGALSWSAVAAGWVWIMGTWAFRPVTASVGSKRV